MTDCKYNCWQVMIREVVIATFLDELGKEDVAYRSRVPGKLIQVVVVTPRKLLKKTVEGRWKAAMDIKPWNYEEFKQYKSQYVQVKYHSDERAEYLRNFFHY